MLILSVASQSFCSNKLRPREEVLGGRLLRTTRAERRVWPFSTFVAMAEQVMFVSPQAGHQVCSL